MITISQRKLLIWVTLPLLLVFMFGGKTFAITITETTKLLASDGLAGDHFGQDFSVSGDFAVVGAPTHNAAYVFHWNGSEWMEYQKLVAPGDPASDQFGSSVSVSGDFIIVGASTDSYVGTNAGAVHFFRYNDNTSLWEHTQEISGHPQPPGGPSPTSEWGGEYFGFSVSVSGDVALVGAVWATEWTWTEPEEVPRNKQYTGAAYVFRYDVDNDTWVEEQKFLPPDATRYDFVGFRVSISGDKALVGAPNYDYTVAASGAAFVYHWDGSTWQEQPKLVAPEPVFNDQFGASVSINGDVAVVGAPHDDDNDVEDSGTAYVFRYKEVTPGTWAWVEEQKLIPSDGAPGDLFGASVFISGNVAAVGTYSDDDSAEDCGSAYVFRQVGTTWVEEQKLIPSDGATYDYFGNFVFTSGDMALVGAPSDDDLGTNSGSVYFYRWDLDSDGIHDSVDVDPLTPSATFSDGTISGSVVSLDPGITIQILDAPDPESIRLLVSGSSGVARIQIDGSEGDYYLGPGQHFINPGSIRLRVNPGEARVVYKIRGETVVLKFISVEGKPAEAVIKENISGDEVQGLDVKAVEGSEGSVTINGVVVIPGESIKYVSIDIKPGSDPNSINLGSEGVIPIAILGSASFSVENLIQSTLQFVGNNAKVKGRSGNIGSLEDVNEDGFIDLVVQFPIEGLELTENDIEATLTGQLLDEDATGIAATDSVRIVP